MKKIILFFIMAPLMATLAGCATIVGSSSQTVSITSEPSNANIKVVDEKGIVTYQGKTPAQINLEKSDGSYFGGKTYTVSITKLGYIEQKAYLIPHPTGWYIAGNFFPWSIIGWLVVDPLSGNMYKLSPSSLNVSLSKNQE